jgi:hypothetical protein
MNMELSAAMDLLAELIKLLPETLKPSLATPILSAVSIWFLFYALEKMLSLNLEIGLMKFPHIKRKERLAKIKFIDEKLKSDLNKPTEARLLEEERSDLLFEEVAGFQAKKTMQDLLMNYREVAPDNMRDWKAICKVFRYLSDENNSLSVNLTIYDRVFMWYSTIIMICLYTFSFVFVFMTFSMNVSTPLYFSLSFISLLVVYFVATTSQPTFQAERIKRFLEKDKPKRTFQQWLQSVISSFKSLAWMPKFNLKAPLQKMTHAEELFKKKGQSH